MKLAGHYLSFYSTVPAIFFHLYIVNQDERIHSFSYLVSLGLGFKIFPTNQYNLSNWTSQPEFSSLPSTFSITLHVFDLINQLNFGLVHNIRTCSIH